MRSIYLDHHTITKPRDAAIAAWLPFLKERWGSTVAPHQMGQELFPYLEKGLETILQTLGAASADPFYFFSSSAEAITYLYQSHYFEGIRQTGKNHLLTSNLEEAPVLMALKRLEELGCSGKILPVNTQGQITKESLNQAICPRTSLVSLSWANGLTGVIHPIADLAQVCRERNVKLHVDASYVLGKLYFRFEDFGIDFLSFEGSLIQAPKGTAGLLLKQASALAVPLSMMTGINVGGVCAVAAALKGIEELCDEMCLETARLRDKLEKGILKGIPGAQVLFSNVERLPNCSCIAFPGVISDALLYLLHRKGVYASLGGGRAQRLTHILIGSGVEEMLAHSALSFSLSSETTEAEIDEAIQTVISCVKMLRECSHKVMEDAIHDPS